MGKRLRLVFLAIGIVAVVVMCFTFEVSFVELWQDLLRAGYWLLAIFAMWGVFYCMNAVSWMIIIRGTGACPVSFLHLLKLTVSGFALNYATPMGLLGGEPYKILEMTPHIGAQRATSSVVLFSMMHVFAHFWYWVTAIVVYAVLGILSVLSLSIGMQIVLALMSVFCFCGIYLFVRGYRKGMVRRLVSIVSRVPFCRRWACRFYAQHEEDLQKIDRQIASLHQQNTRSFYASFLLEYVGRVLQSFEVFFILLLFGKEGSMMTFVNAYLILAFTSLFANLLFFFPLQLGGREGGFAMSTVQVGMTNEIGIFISLICRVRELFWVSIGVVLMMMHTGSRRQSPDEGSDSE